MKTINALSLRNHLGTVLQEIEGNKEPVLVTKGGKVIAALVGIDDFKKRFLDRQAEEEKRKWMEGLHELVAPRIGDQTALGALRALRGYRT
jgi:prevent-host-death family protein